MAKYTIDVDVEKIIEELLEEGDASNWRIKQSVQLAIKKDIESEVVRDIKESLNLSDFKQFGSNYTTAWLSRTASELLDKELSKHVKEHVEEYIKKDLKNYILRQTKDIIEQMLVPHLQRIVSSLVVINQDNIDAQIADMEKMAQDMANEAYEAGQSDVHKHY